MTLFTISSFCEVMFNVSHFFIASIAFSNYIIIHLYNNIISMFLNHILLYIWISITVLSQMKACADVSKMSLSEYGLHSWKRKSKKSRSPRVRKTIRFEMNFVKKKKKKKKKTSPSSYIWYFIENEEKSEKKMRRGEELIVE